MVEWGWGDLKQHISCSNWVPRGDRLPWGRDNNGVGDWGGGAGFVEADGCVGEYGGDESGGDDSADDGYVINSLPPEEDDLDELPDSDFSKAAARVFGSSAESRHKLKW